MTGRALLPPAAREGVRYEPHDGIARITLDRPEQRNALSRQVRQGLFAVVERFEQDTGARRDEAAGERPLTLDGSATERQPRSVEGESACPAASTA